MKAFFLSLSILLGLNPISARDGVGSIEGVVRVLSGAPVAEASVYAVDLNDIRRRINATTDSNGRFFLRDLPPGSYSVHAYKESEGYPDTFYSFFAIGDRAWRRVEVQAGRATNGVVLEIGPKYAVLKLSIEDEQGNPVGGSLTFRRVDDAMRPYMVGSSPNQELLVPPVPFRFQIEAEGYQVWQSGLIKPRSEETVSIGARLKRSH